MVTENISIRLTDIRYRRDSAFSYTCHACCRCCHDKIIQVNPYEVARLAHNRRISTTEFLARYTDANGTVLRQTDKGAGVFLTPESCGVHQDRPLVCRLYPLGRRVGAEGAETFGEVIPHPQTEGEYGTKGTVQDVLMKQGAEPFIEAVERYVDLVGRMVVKVHASAQNDNDFQASIEHIAGNIAQRQAANVPGWQDMDEVLARYCGERAFAVPTDVTEKMNVHIQAVSDWVDGR